MNLANWLTLARILLIPIFMIFILVRIPYGEYVAAIVFIIAASTDGLDGYIARSRNQVTKLGRLMDPLADKLLVAAALISLVEVELVPAWIAVLIIGREFAVTGLRTIAADEGIILSASKLGKLKTVFQITAVVTLLLNEFFIYKLDFSLGLVVLYVAAFITILSGIDYFLKAWKDLKLYKA